MAASNTKTVVTYVLSLSLFCVTAALVYFSIKVSEITQAIPDLLEGIETTAAKIEPVVNEINEIRELIPPILEEVKQTRLMVPPILEEVKQTRLMIPPILKETASIRETVPPILQQVDKTTLKVPTILKELNATRAIIPSITESVHAASDVIVIASTEMTATRESLPELMRQVEETRDAMPSMIVDVERIVDKAQQAGQDASKGAVTGVLKGILAAPFKIVGGVGQTVFTSLNLNAKKLSDKDQDTIKKMSHELLNLGVVGETRMWTNPENDNKVVISYVKSFSKKGRDCKILKFKISKLKKNIANKKITACLDKNSEWEIQD